jgi:hypothetical protein
MGISASELVYPMGVGGVNGLAGATPGSQPFEFANDGGVSSRNRKKFLL